jgi:staphylococcal nuclease domain-containing protein 1
LISSPLQNGTKAAQFLPSWKRAGKHQALVDFVASGSRFKLFLPKENKKMTFVLAGGSHSMLCHRAMCLTELYLSVQEKGEPYGTEGQKWTNTRYMQRDVEISEFSASVLFETMSGY